MNAPPNSPRSPLVLSADLRKQIEEEGVAAYPNECCGILIGSDKERKVDRIIPMANAFDPQERYHRFSIDPLLLASTEESAAAEGKAVIGFYHSHPDHPARPSETDRQAAWPFYSYVIVSIAKREPLDMTCWVLDEQTETFKRQEIVEEERPS